MATTYQSEAVAKGYQPRLLHAGVTPVTVEFDATTALVIDDVIEMIPLAEGVSVLDVILSTEDLDSGTALLLDVGDGDTDDRYIAADTVGQAGGVARMSLHGGHGHTYTADDTLDVHVDTAPTGDGTGVIRLTAFLSQEGVIS